LVSVRSASAFCPGHITGFFQIRDEKNEFFKKGSIGSGFNTAAGALSRASIIPLGNTEYLVEPIPDILLSLRIDGVPASEEDLPVTRDMVSRFISLYDTCGELPEIKSSGITLELNTCFNLPLSQGFGMSGAGLISQVMALNRLFDSRISREDCFRMAHHSEIVHGTGLGDIPAQSVGGFTIREREGLPPYGIIHSIPATNKVILAVQGSSLLTREIILDEAQRSCINRHSEGMVDLLLTQLPSNPDRNQMFEPGSTGPLLAEMASLSFRFARDTGLMDPETGELCREINKTVSPGSSMCMLGNSIFVIFSHETSTEDDVYKKVKRMLLDRGKVFETSISPAGARVL